MLHVDFGHHRCEFEPWDPRRGRLFRSFAYDTETSTIVESRPDLIPEVVLATAYDGNRGVLIARENLLAFFEAHDKVPFICHNAAFDLAVTQQLFGGRRDIYAAVEANEVWCTLVLARLLSLATAGHTAQDECGLRECVARYLQIDLPKDVVDGAGQAVRVNFGRYLHGPLTAIPPEYLRYAARDTMATWHLFGALKERIRAVLQSATGVFGYVDAEWLQSCIARFGPLTHHLQLRASIVLDAINRTGLAVDACRRQEKLAHVEAEIQGRAARLNAAGFVVHGLGSQKFLQSRLDQFHDQHPEVPLKTTAKGKWSTSEDSLAPLAQYDAGLADYTAYKVAEKLRGTYLEKMDMPVVYPKFRYLKTTGRTSCDGGLNLQALPREDLDNTSSPSIRGCFVPRPGYVFVDVDYSQIELVVLAYVWKYQLCYGDSLHNLINEGRDLHRRIASLVQNKPPEEITKAERAAAKPVSFGRPGGMGPASLQDLACKSYGLMLTVDEVEQRIAAYHRLCPELDAHLQDEVPSAAIICETLGLTLDGYNVAIGSWTNGDAADPGESYGWLSGMLLKVLRDPCPTTANGTYYSSPQIDFFWSNAQGLLEHLDKKWAEPICHRESSEDLYDAVRDWAGRRPVFTLTGRLRANATFCASRNTLFQGAAADGAICALWLLWRAGFRVVSIIHDQVVVESPADDHVLERKKQIEKLLVQGMQMVIPGMLVKVETVVSASLNKTEIDDRYINS